MAKKRKGRWTIARRVVQIVVAILFFVPISAAGWSALGLGFLLPKSRLRRRGGFAWWGSLVVAFVRLDLLDPFAALRLRRRRKTLLLPVLLGRFLFWWLTAWFAGALFAAGRVR